ncbi:MAG: c-type cytochrome [FCB group bacterium]|nr:c-type cytochrome [FCB group bacterium]
MDKRTDKKIGLLVFLLLTGIVFAKNRPKNLKVLKFESIRETKQYMKDVAKDLGVKCKYCHDLSDKAIDTENKRVARRMMRMTDDLNTGFFNWEKAPQITCWTCHRGEKEPETARP